MKKWMSSRKAQMGLVSFVALIVFNVLEACGVMVIDVWTKTMLTSISVGWLAAEGWVDGQRVSGDNIDVDLGDYNEEFEMSIDHDEPMTDDKG